MKQDFWTNRYEEKQTGWSVGNVSTPIKEYLDQLDDKNLRILIPGCGFGYEVVYAWQSGFKNVYALDFVEEALQSISKMEPSIPENQLLREDFFSHEGSYDLIIEQTLFCAIDPSDREKYVSKIRELLVPGGKLAGVLFDREFENSPPFGGSREEYLQLFSAVFDKVNIEKCYNSIPQRKGTEVFAFIEK